MITTLTMSTPGDCYEQGVGDYYTEKIPSGVPQAAGWETLKNKAMLSTDAVLWVAENTGQDAKLRSVFWLVDKVQKGHFNPIFQYDRLRVVTFSLLCRKSIMYSDLFDQRR